ncbi:MAG: fibronectin type III domain-containing protein [Bdellovibrionaceae bacterium]|nr:fibronectin type III domain-containing protein [Pseudobdellovibrionaceae bacterium]
MLLVGCDFNPLGGNKSRLDPTFEPGKHIASQPPTISVIPDFTIDENDVQTINFTINDTDSFMMCSFVNVKTSSANTTIIDSSGLTVGGTYPNCTLRIAPKLYQFGLVDITVSAYDFWSTVPTTFKLNVVHILAPGAFSIIDAIGSNGAVEVSWQNAAYMFSTGAFTSPFYTIFYREADIGAPWNSVQRVTSPYNVTGLTNGTEYEFYILATNSVGTRASNTVRAFPTKFQYRTAAFVPMSLQYENTAGTGTTVHIANATMEKDVMLEDANYPVFNHSAAEIPTNGNFPLGTPKGSSVTTPSGRYNVYVGSQGNILSGAER